MRTSLFSLIRATQKMVTTGTVKFETMIPEGKSRNQTEKNIWNEDFILSYRNPIENVWKPIKIIVCSIFHHMLLRFSIFFYLFESLIPRLVTRVHDVQKNNKKQVGRLLGNPTAVFRASNSGDLCMSCPDPFGNYQVATCERDTVALWTGHAT